MHNLLKEETEDRYTDDFVVEIEGGNFTAVRIAEECGLDYVEEVFPNHFHFKVRSKFQKFWNILTWFENFENSNYSINRKQAKQYILQ